MALLDLSFVKVGIKGLFTMAIKESMPLKFNKLLHQMVLLQNL